MIAATWGEFLNGMWNTEIVSWNSLGGLMVLASVSALVGIAR